MRRRLVVAGAVVVVSALVSIAILFGFDVWREARRGDLERALAMAPADSQRFAWTDWADVRAELDADLSADSSSGDVRDFLAEGFEADLTSTSALVESAPALHTKFGFSPATAEWELLSQSEEGALLLVALADSDAVDVVAERLEEIGYTPPSSEGGVWLGGADLVATVGGVSPELQYVALDRDRGLVLAGDREDYVADALAGVEDASMEDLPEGVRDVVAGVGDPQTGVVYAAEQACSALAMSQADESEQELAAQLVEDAGEINPVTGFAMTAQPDGHVRVAMGFESQDQARTNADTRSVLASGPAPGQGGDFADRFEVVEVTAEDGVVVMDLLPAESSYVVSDLSSGPVLFATC